MLVLHGVAIYSKSGINCQGLNPEKCMLIGMRGLIMHQRFTLLILYQRRKDLSTNKGGETVKVSFDT